MSVASADYSYCSHKVSLSQMYTSYMCSIWPKHMELFTEFVAHA